MRSNHETVKAASDAQILAEYERIKAKTSKLPRNLRDRVTDRALSLQKLKNNSKKV